MATAGEKLLQERKALEIREKEDMSASMGYLQLKEEEIIGLRRQYAEKQQRFDRKKMGIFLKIVNEELIIDIKKMEHIKHKQRKETFEMTILQIRGEASFIVRINSSRGCKLASTHATMAEAVQFFESQVKELPICSHLVGHDLCIYGSGHLHIERYDFI